MERPFRHIIVDRKGDVFCVRLREHRMEETDILEMSDELLSLIIDQGCRRLAIRLGPDALECLYSVFLAKLVTVRRRLLECGGHLVLYEVTPEVHGVFEACHLKDYFDFAENEQAAVQALAER